MKNKALKNIPKPDEEKLALFYGRKTESLEELKGKSELSTVDNMSTVDKMTTVDKMSTVVNEGLLKDILKSLVTPSQQAIYLNLYTLSFTHGRDTSDWIGYGGLAKELGISLKTVQRAVAKLIHIHLIKRINLINTADTKGSRYQIMLPEKMSTVDK